MSVRVLFQQDAPTGPRASNSAATSSESDAAVHRHLLETAVKDIAAVRGDGTSLITLFVPAKVTALQQAISMLQQELATSVHIKKRVTRHAVQGSITSILGQLRQLRRVPANGLIVYSGTDTKSTKDEQHLWLIEPLMPVTRSSYICDSSFHVDTLDDQLAKDDGGNYGIVVIDGHGALLAMAEAGRGGRILARINANLPRKHNKGAYCKQVAEKACELFTKDGDTKPLDGGGLVIAGCADLKDELIPCLPSRLQSSVKLVVDVAYGGKAGYHEAMRHVYGLIGSSRVTREVDAVQQLLSEIDRDSSCYVLADVGAVTEQLQAGTARLLLISADYDSKPLAATRIDSCHENGGLVNGACDTDISPSQTLIKEAQRTNARVQIVTDTTQEGRQFVTAFGGLAVITRYPVLDMWSDYDGDSDDASSDSDAM